MARYPEFEHLYNLYQDFQTPCLLNDNSFFLPDQQIWTAENISSLLYRMKDNPDTSNNKFDEKLQLQMQTASPQEWGVLAEAHLLYYLPPKRYKPETREDKVMGYLRRGYPNLTQIPSPAFWATLTGFFTPATQYGNRYNQIMLILTFAEALKHRSDRQAVLSSPIKMRDLLEEQNRRLSALGIRAYDMQYALLYLAFPDTQEPIVAVDARKQILDRYRPMFSINEPDNDVALHQIHQRLAQQRGVPSEAIHFYDTDDIKNEWQSLSTPKLVKPETPSLKDVTADAAPVKHDPGVSHALTKLSFTKNLIFTGAPGTGKTYTALNVARALVKPQLKSTTQQFKDFIQIVAFHPSYAYEDFVEGMRPVVDEVGNLSYVVRPGFLRVMCSRAVADPDNRYVLIIDEINRANLSKVFGELISLIEDDKRLGMSNGLTMTLPYSGETFSVPSNLYFIGTLNTADRSIALMDVAMRRRFAFIEVPPRPNLIGKIVTNDGTELDLGRVLSVLNKRIRGHVGRSYEIGHSYFIGIPQAAPERQIMMLSHVWNTQILPLLEEYFYSSPDTLREILAEFVLDDDTGEERLGVAEGEDLISALSRLYA